jgi:hypothetical protein
LHVSFIESVEGMAEEISSGEVREARAGDIDTIVALHISRLGTGAFAALGTEFLKRHYRGALGSTGRVVHVYAVQDEVIGFLETHLGSAEYQPDLQRSDFARLVFTFLRHPIRALDTVIQHFYRHRGNPENHGEYTFMATRPDTQNRGLSGPLMAAGALSAKAAGRTAMKLKTANFPFGEHLRKKYGARESFAFRTPLAKFQVFWWPI